MKTNHRIKSLLLLSLILLICFCSNYDKNIESRISIIPNPQELVVGEGSFTLNENTKIIIDSDDPIIGNVANYLSDQFYMVSGVRLHTAESEEYENAIVFSSNKLDDSFGEEEYTLQSDNHGVTLRGSAKGLFYATQTLFQLLPENIYEKVFKENTTWSIPTVYIKDKPRFKWRGMHLDVGRHMFPVSFIKKYIDYLAIHKLNTFHWHLTEDQGWRIEIKKYPLLTEIGSKRKGTTLANLNKPDVLDGIPYGGYYTQKEIKEIVKYAGERFITVVPEIELPGHSRAALASYPHLSCTGGPFEVRTNWGVDENIYCAGNDDVFSFLENVLSEVIELFPSEYIHIGGDEAPKSNWQKCNKCQSRIISENLKDEHELQSYFITRIEKFLNEKGRKIIGWDEILEGGLAPNAAVMSWRGIKGGIEAARQNHNVVMSPTSHCYFDFYQAIPENEPRAIGGFLPLEKVYNYEPIPDELSPDEVKFIIGVQANVWTEYITTPEKVEYMALPRLCALSEVAWTTTENKNLIDFLERMNKHYGRLDALGANYSWPKMDLYNSKNVFIDEQKVKLESKRSGVEIRFTLDGSKPNANSNLYSEPFYLSESKDLKVREFAFNGKQSPLYTFKFNKQKPSDPVEINNTSPGLAYDYYEFNDPIDSTIQLLDFAPIRSGDVSVFKFPVPEQQLPEKFGLILTGFIELEKTGVYTFSVLSNDGSRLYVSDQLVVENDGWHGAFEKAGSIALSAGMHKIKLFYFQVGGQMALDVFIKDSSNKKVKINPNILSY